ncbi:unnamed protein product, partial [Sphagnum jensenii]
NIVAQNRKARHDYFIEEIFEAGIVLEGTEVKSLREGKASIIDAHASENSGGLYLLNCYIPEYSKANRFNHFPRRPRKLLLHRREINKLMGKVKLKGYTIVPISIYFNNKNKAKIELGLAKGKAQHDKRATIKQREWDREKGRISKRGSDDS